MPKGTPPPTKDRDKVQFEFEQVFTGDAARGRRPAALTRRFVAAPGEHDVYVVAQPAPGPEPRKNDVMVKGVAKKFEVTVPDLWNA